MLVPDRGNRPTARGATVTVSYYYIGAGGAITRGQGEGGGGPWPPGAAYAVTYSFATFYN